MNEEYVMRPGEVATGRARPGEEVGTVVSADWNGSVYIGCKISVNTPHGDRFLKYFPYGTAIRYEQGSKSKPVLFAIPKVRGGAINSFKNAGNAAYCPSCK